MRYRGGTVVLEAGGVRAEADLSQPLELGIIVRTRGATTGPSVVGRARVCAV